MKKGLQKFEKRMKKLIKDSKDIYIIGHNDPDFDSLGAAVGMAEICKILGKDSKIIINEDEFTLQPAVKSLNDLFIKDYHFINLEGYIKGIKKDNDKESYSYVNEFGEEDENYFLKQKVFKDSLLIIVDTNNQRLLSNNEYLKNYDNVIIIDHHDRISSKLVKKSTNFIDSNYSSACEIVGTILHKYKKDYSKALALALASGIKLDTDTFKRNTTDNTHKTYGIFKKNGVTDEVIAKLFRRNFESDKLVKNLVFNNGNAKEFTNLLKNHNVSIVLNRTNPGQIYKPEMISQAADERQDYDDVDASIVMGYIGDDENKEVKISIRTNGYVHGGKLMKNYCQEKENREGGGRIISAAAKIKNTDLLQEEQNLIDYLDKVVTDDYKVTKKSSSKKKTKKKRKK